ncbi:CY domain-containing protein [Anabas testudineus]|uniref:Cystatin domain-containing protein n=1 Tax=Anabas testudineus TaxID=64144 RepID=A0A3Q1H1F9_ANATE|nr:CY domain-containing protein [Anabas testudineus]
MYLPLALLICLSLIQLSIGDQPVEERIVPRKHHRTGGWFDLHPGAIDVQEAADHGVKMFNTKSKGKKMFKLISVIGVKTQLTNMIVYKIDALLGKTNCSKSDNRALDSCSVSVKNKKMRCLFVVSHKPFLGQHELLKQRCKKHLETTE